MANDALTELSQQLNDYFVGTTTSDGAVGGTTIIDTSMMSKANDWVNYDTWVRITSGACDGEERKASSLDNTTGTLTILACSAQIVTGVTYEVHRMFSASAKRRALVAACRRVFPYLYLPIRDESRVSGNWLKDGSFEAWTSSSALTYWTKSLITEAQTSTAPYVKHGTYSLKMDTAAGYIEQSFTDNDDLKRLAGRYVTFTCQGWSDTASCLRLGINDGTTTTYSSYHDGDSAWTENGSPLSVSATIQDNPTAITFRIYLANLAGTNYVDDARVLSEENPRIFIGDIGLINNHPHQVFLEPRTYYNGEPWERLHGWTVDEDGGYLLLPYAIPYDYRLRLVGIGLLKFLYNGVESDSWAATVDLTTPQLDLLVAEAALVLYTNMSMPNFSSGDRKAYMEMINFWKQEAREHRSRVSMRPPAPTIHWGN